MTFNTQFAQKIDQKIFEKRPTKRQQDRIDPEIGHAFLLPDHTLFPGSGNSISIELKVCVFFFLLLLLILFCFVLFFKERKR